MSGKIAKWLKTLGRCTAALSIEQAQREWQTAIDAVQDLIFIHDAEMCIIRANRAYAVRAGKAIHELIGKPYWTLFPKLDSPLPGCLRSQEEHQGGEELLRLGSGEEYVSRSYPIYGAEGKYLYSVHVMQNVTEKRKVEAEQRTLIEALRESENRLTVIMESVQTGIVIIEPDTHKIVYVNSIAASMIGAPKEEIVGSVCHRFICPAEKGKCPITDLHQTVDHSERVLLTTTGVGRPIIKSVTTVLLGGKEHLLESYIDITERKLAEQALHDSEEKFRTISTSAQDAVIMLDNQGNISYWNLAAEKIFGYTREEVQGQNLHALLAPERFREASRKGFDHFKASGEGAAIGKTLELAALRKGGEEFAMEVSLSAVKLGNQWSAIGIVRDITERKLAEEKIRKLNEELETKVQERTKQLLEAQEELVRKEKLAVLGQVAGSVGHELRNPLGVMSNAVYFLQTVLADADETTKEYLNIIKDEIAGSERIVSDLLDAVRTQSPHPEIVGVQELIEQTLRKCSVPSSVTVKLDIPATLPPLAGGCHANPAGVPQPHQQRRGSDAGRRHVGDPGSGRRSGKEYYRQRT